MTATKFVSCLALVAVATIATADDLKQKIEANYAAMASAFKRNDISVFEKLYSPGLTVIPPSGKVISRATQIADLKRQMVNMHDVTWVRHVTKLTHMGKDVQVMVSGHFVGSFKAQDGKMHKFDLHSSVQDIWSTFEHGLQIKSSKALKLDAKIDGKAPGG